MSRPATRIQTLSSVEDALAFAPYVRKIVGGFHLDKRDEDECVQDALFKLATVGVRNWRADKASATTYTFSVARNEAIRRRTKTRHVRDHQWQEIMRSSARSGVDGTAVADLLPDTRNEDALDQLLRRERLQHIQRAIRFAKHEAPEATRILLRHAGGVTYAVMAVDTGLSIQAFSNRARRARRLILHALKEV